MSPSEAPDATPVLTRHIRAGMAPSNRMISGSFVSTYVIISNLHGTFTLYKLLGKPVHSLKSINNFLRAKPAKTLGALRAPKRIECLDIILFFAGFARKNKRRAKRAFVFQLQNGFFV